MKKNGSIIIGSFILALLTAIYLIVYRERLDQALTWVALVLILISGCVSILLFKLSEGEPKRVAAGVIWIIQTIISVIASAVIVLRLDSENEDVYFNVIVFFLVTAGIAGLITLVIYVLDKKSGASIEAQQQAISAINQCRAVVNSMLSTEAGSKHKKELRLLDENLRFSDNSSTDPLDAEILSNLNVLSSKIRDDNFNVKDAIDSINGLISRRNFSVKNKK